MLAALNARVAKLERKRPGLTPGLDRCTDDELQGMIDIIKQAQAGEAIDPERMRWANDLIQRENLWRLFRP